MWKVSHSGLNICCNVCFEFISYTVLNIVNFFPQAVKIIKKPKDVTALENAVVSFELSVSHDTVPVRWFHKNIELKQSDKYKMISQRKVHKLMLHNISPDDAGEYTALVGQIECKAKLFVESKYCKKVVI